MLMWLRCARVVAHKRILRLIALHASGEWAKKRTTLVVNRITLIMFYIYKRNVRAGEKAHAQPRQIDENNAECYFFPKSFLFDCAANGFAPLHQVKNLLGDGWRTNKKVAAKTKSRKKLFAEVRKKKRSRCNQPCNETERTEWKLW